MSNKALAFLDPYWLGSLQSLSVSALRSCLRGYESTIDLERVYLYSESDEVVRGDVNTAVSLRVCAKDSLDDGYEIVRGMDVDLSALTQSGRHALFVVASMDDRLALTIERVKSSGIKVIGLQTNAIQMDLDVSGYRRMSRVFDEVLNIPDLPQANSPSSSAESDFIKQAIDQWVKETDEMTRDSAIEFMNARRGLPKTVDARLLFLGKQLLNRELTEAEKFEMRRRFRLRLEGR